MTAEENIFNYSDEVNRMEIGGNLIAGYKLPSGLFSMRITTLG
jgi:hypothetical protein